MGELTVKNWNNIKDRGLRFRVSALSFLSFISVSIVVLALILINKFQAYNCEDTVEENEYK